MRAIVSVANKTGIVAFAQGLSALNVESPATPSPTLARA